MDSEKYFLEYLVFFLKILFKTGTRLKLQVLLISKQYGVSFFGTQEVKCLTIQIFYDLTSSKRRS